MSFIKDFKQRGYFYQCTDLEKLESTMQNEKIAAYIGFDCTAKSLHVGNLMQVMILRLLQQHGHKPIVIVGGATTKIGDPTGKDEARKVLTDTELEQNIAGIKYSLSKFIQFGDGENDAILVNNSDWLESLNYINFLRDFGKHFSINRMLTMDSVRLRLGREQNLTFLEFNYMLLQAYDFYYLNKHFNCKLQLGGSDQWGNIVMGVDLTRKLSGKDAFGLTTPLLTTSSGTKMGKSLSGAVWLNEDMLSPYDYYQYWRNCEDPDVIRFAKLYAEFSEQQINEITNLSKQDINAAKKLLAHRLTELCHGKAAANSAQETARRVFEEGKFDENLPTIEIESSRLNSGITAFELFFETGLAESKSESRKLIRGGGARINDHKIDDENLKINSSYLNEKDLMKLSSGKKKHILIKPRN